MLTKTKQPTMIRLVMTIAFLPATIAYKLAYHLVGVQTTYRWGDMDVKPMTSVSEGQFLFSRMFPLLLYGVPLLILWGLS